MVIIVRAVVVVVVEEVTIEVISIAVPVSTVIVVAI